MQNVLWIPNHLHPNKRTLRGCSYMYPQPLEVLPAEIKHAESNLSEVSLFTPTIPDACGESWETLFTSSSRQLGVGGWLGYPSPPFHPLVLSEVAATAAWVAELLVKLFLNCNSLLTDVLKAFPDVLETISKTGMRQTAEDSNFTTHSSCTHGCLWLNTLKLFSFAQRPGTPSRKLSSAWVGRRASTSRTSLEHAARKGNWWLKEVPGTPSLSCIFQQTVNGNAVQEAAAGERNVAALYIAAAAAAWRASSLATNC